MAHDATHGHDHDHDHSHAAPLPGSEPKSKTGLRSAFFLVAIIAGLFIAALNFISAMGHSEEGHGSGEAHAPATHQATSNQTMHGEGGSGAPAEHGVHEAGTATHDDTAAHGEHH